MQAYQQRVIDEQIELDDKLNKLKAFIMENPIYKTLPSEEQKRLNRQYDIMVEYTKILSERIKVFEG